MCCNLQAHALIKCLKFISQPLFCSISILPFKYLFTLNIIITFLVLRSLTVYIMHYIHHSGSQVNICCGYCDACKHTACYGLGS